MAVVGCLKEATHHARALSLTSDGVLVKLSPEKAFSVCSDQSRRMRRVYPSFSTMPKPFDDVNPPKSARQKKKNAAASGEPQSSCPCHGCRDAKNYQNNMSDRGEQKPFQEPLSTGDLLRFFGRLNSDWAELIARASELTVGCYDIETLSIGNDLRSGEEDTSFPFVPLMEGSGSSAAVPPSSAAATPGGADAAASVSSDSAGAATDVGKASRRLLGVHRPVLIGFIDERMTLDGSDVAVIGGWSLEDETRSTSDLVSDFMSLVFRSRCEAVREKRRLLAPIFEFFQRFKTAHDSFFDCYDFSAFYGEYEMERELLTRLMRLPAAALVDGTDLVSRNGALSPASLRRFVEEDKRQRAKDGWEKTMLGVMHKRLETLAEAYHLYAFNASGFDAVLLAPYLITEAKNRSRSGKVSLLREGNKIRQLKVDNINFLDSKYLAPPGCSLDQWSKLAQVETSKGMFPFKLLKSHAFLRERSLPRDAAQWTSDLDPGKKVTQEQVDELLAEFDALGCDSVGSFLSFYLKKDVVCLMQCMKKMMRTYHKTMGLHLPDVAKFSISSLSNCSAQHYLARRKRIAFTFPNHTLIYSVSSVFSVCFDKPVSLSSLSQLLARSLRGGMTQVHRTVAGSQAPYDSYADILRRQLEQGEDPDVVAPNLDLYPSLESYLRAINASSLPRSMGVGQPANYVEYVDTISLYSGCVR